MFSLKGGKYGRYTAIVVALLVGGVLWFAGTHHDLRPTVADCTIGFDLDWSVVDGKRDDALRKMDILRGSQASDSLAIYSYNHDHTQLFLIYWQDCDRKQEFAEQLFAGWKDKGLVLPAFREITKPYPAVKEFAEPIGEHWRDSRQEY